MILIAVLWYYQNIVGILSNAYFYDTAVKQETKDKRKGNFMYRKNMLLTL